MAKMTGGQAVVKALEAEGASLAFGVMGSTLMPTYDALYDSSIRLIAPRSEDGAGHMADAACRVSGGEPGVLLTTVGPGAAGAVAAMGEAYNESWPMLHITTQIPSKYLDKQKGVYHDGPNQIQNFKTVSSWQHRVTKVGEIPEAINEAYRRMRTGRPRPVYLEIPSDVLNAEANAKILSPANVAQPPVPKQALAEAIKLIKKGKRPILWVGGGGVKAKAMPEVKALAEMLQAPVFCTNGSKGVLSDDHPLSLGNMLSVSKVLQDGVLAKGDVVIAVGTRFSQRATKQWTVPMPKNIVHIDIDKNEFGRNYKPKVAVKGDAKAVLQAMLTALGKDGYEAAQNRYEETQAFKKQALDELKKRQPAEFDLLQDIRRVLPRDAILASQSIMGHWTRFGLDCYQPGCFLFASTYGSMGFSFHAAIGAKARYPDRTVVSFCGDGGFMFGAGEMATIQKYNLNMPIVIFNNGGYSILRQRQDAMYGRNIGTELSNPDFMKFAESFGFKGVRVKEVGEVAPRIEEALADGKTWVIEVPIEFAGYRSAAETEMLLRGAGKTV
ncbi:MAG: thiamine pyrophosphate-binding protein [Rhodospirillales bacterium]